MKLIVHPELGAKLKKTAEELEITEYELIRESLTSYLKRINKPIPWEIDQEHLGQDAKKPSQKAIHR